MDIRYYLRVMMKQKRKSIEEGTRFLSTFEFTLPLLPAGKYSFTVSIADGGLFDHQQLQWMNDALIFESTLLNSSHLFSVKHNM